MPPKKFQNPAFWIKIVWVFSKIMRFYVFLHILHILYIYTEIRRFCHQRSSASSFRFWDIGIWSWPNFLFIWEDEGLHYLSCSTKKTKKLGQLQMPISRKRKELEELRWWQNDRNFGAVSKFKKTFLKNTEFFVVPNNGIRISKMAHRNPKWLA